MKAFLHPPGILAQIRGQRGHQLVLRGDHCSIEPECRRRAREPCEEQRAGFALRQPVQPHAIAVEQTIAALGAAIGINGNARRRERVDIAIDRAHRHFARFRQLGRGDLPPGLERGEDRQHPARAHGSLNHT
jgi:hypothetical protein